MGALQSCEIALIPGAKPDGCRTGDSSNFKGPLTVWQTSQLPVRARSDIRSQDQMLQPLVSWRYLKHRPAVVACSDQGRVCSPRGRRQWHQIPRRRTPYPTRNYRRMIKGLNIRIDHSSAGPMHSLWACGEVPAHYLMHYHHFECDSGSFDDVVNERHTRFALNTLLQGDGDARWDVFRRYDLHMRNGIWGC